MTYTIPLASCAVVERNTQSDDTFSVVDTFITIQKLRNAAIFTLLNLPMLTVPNIKCDHFLYHSIGETLLIHSVTFFQIFFSLFCF
jgi:hypothetical protein